MYFIIPVIVRYIYYLYVFYHTCYSTVYIICMYFIIPVIVRYILSVCKAPPDIVSRRGSEVGLPEDDVVRPAAADIISGLSDPRINGEPIRLHYSIQVYQQFCYYHLNKR